MQIGSLQFAMFPLRSPGEQVAIELTLACLLGPGVAMHTRLVRTATPAAALEDRAAQSLEDGVVTMAEGEEVLVFIGAALITREDVMHVEDGGAFSTEEATATAVLIALEDASPDVVPGLLHRESRFS